MRKTLLAILTIVIFGFLLIVPAALAQDQCVPFGGTIYGWQNGDSWFGMGDFTVAKDVMHATVTDPNTGFKNLGDIWLGTEEATFDFGKGNKIVLMTDFVTRVGTLQLAGPVWPGRCPAEHHRTRPQ